MTAKAVYYHASITMELFQEFLVDLDRVQQSIKEDINYTPFVVQSDENDLTYRDMIEIMAWLKGKEEEEVVLRYYHEQMTFHALARGFNSEIVRGSWSQERKLYLLEKCRKSAKDTIDYAKETMRILKKLQDVQERGGHKKGPPRRS